MLRLSTPENYAERGRIGTDEAFVVEQLSHLGFALTDPGGRLIKSSPSSPIVPDPTIERKRPANLQICPASCWDDARENEGSG